MLDQKEVAPPSAASGDSGWVAERGSVSSMERAIGCRAAPLIRRPGTTLRRAGAGSAFAGACSTVSGESSDAMCLRGCGWRVNPWLEDLVQSVIVVGITQVAPSAAGMGFIFRGVIAAS